MIDKLSSFFFAIALFTTSIAIYAYVSGQISMTAFLISEGGATLFFILSSIFNYIEKRRDKNN